MGSTQKKAKSLITNDFLCDDYVIDEQILFDVNLIKQKK
jgi:hypothetical protein